jgi:hypothetical protein
MDHPREGQVINVLCYPKSQKVTLIAQDWKYSPGKSDDEQQAEEERFNAAEHGSPGQSAAPLAQGPAADQLTMLGQRHERGGVGTVVGIGSDPTVCTCRNDDANEAARDERSVEPK